MKRIDQPLKVTIKELLVDHYYTGVVRPGYGTSARINVPKELEGKRVIIIVQGNKRGKVRSRHLRNPQ